MEVLENARVNAICEHSPRREKQPHSPNKTMWHSD